MKLPRSTQPYIATHQGWLYLIVVVDLFSCKVVGWSMADHMRTNLVLTALESAFGQRIPAQSGLVFHSDRGSQYASSDYRSALEFAGITCNMSHKGMSTFWRLVHADRLVGVR